mmetsp:Transcript_27141/g.71407  ORF Transcript_27141/g.71407 Transcript_27141/m.71407 type:complete len:1451 (-) Transcript_27141:313-4665(-)
MARAVDSELNRHEPVPPPVYLRSPEDDAGLFGRFSEFYDEEERRTSRSMRPDLRKSREGADDFRTNLRKDSDHGRARQIADHGEPQLRHLAIANWGLNSEWTESMAGLLPLGGSELDSEVEILEPSRSNSVRPSHRGMCIVDVPHREEARHPGSDLVLASARESASESRGMGHRSQRSVRSGSKVRREASTKNDNPFGVRIEERQSEQGGGATHFREEARRLSEEFSQQEETRHPESKVGVFPAEQRFTDQFGGASSFALHHEHGQDARADVQDEAREELRWGRRSGHIVLDTEGMTSLVHGEHPMANKKPSRVTPDVIEYKYSMQRDSEDAGSSSVFMKTLTRDESVRDHGGSGSRGSHREQERTRSNSHRRDFLRETGQRQPPSISVAATGSLRGEVGVANDMPSHQVWQTGEFFDMGCSLDGWTTSCEVPHSESHQLTRSARELRGSMQDITQSLDGTTESELWSDSSITRLEDPQHNNMQSFSLGDLRSKGWATSEGRSTGRGPDGQPKRRWSSKHIEEHSRGSFAGRRASSGAASGSVTASWSEFGDVVPFSHRCMEDRCSGDSQGERGFDGRDSSCFAPGAAAQASLISGEHLRESRAERASGISFSNHQDESHGAVRESVDVLRKTGLTDDEVVNRRFSARGTVRPSISIRGNEVRSEVDEREARSRRCTSHCAGASQREVVDGGTGSRRSTSQCLGEVQREFCGMGWSASSSQRDASEQHVGVSTGVAADVARRRSTSRRLSTQQQESHPETRKNSARVLHASRELRAFEVDPWTHDVEASTPLHSHHVGLADEAGERAHGSRIRRVDKERRENTVPRLSLPRSLSRVHRKSAHPDPPVDRVEDCGSAPRANQGSVLYCDQDEPYEGFLGALAESGQDCGSGESPTDTDQARRRVHTDVPSWLIAGRRTTRNRHESIGTVSTSVETRFHTRASCRFTKRRLETYVGIGPHALAQAHRADDMYVLDHFEHAAVTLLLKRADEIRDGVSGRSDRVHLASVVEDLGSAFALHHQIFQESGKITAVGGVPALLVLVVRLVEMLDVFVSPEEVSDDSCDHSVQTRRTCEVPPNIFGPGGFVNISFEILEGKMRQGLEKVAGHALAEELELHATLVVRLVLSWEPPVGAPHPANMIHAVKGDQTLLNFAKFILETRPHMREMHMPTGRRDLGVLSLVIDSLHLCFRRFCTSRLRSWRGNNSGTSEKHLRGQRLCELIVPLVPVTLETLRIASVCGSQEPGVRHFDVAAVCDAAASSAIDVLAVLGMPFAGPPACADCAHAVAESLARLLQLQAATVRLLQALRRMVTRSFPAAPWLGNFGGSHPKQKFLDALVQRDVLPLCIEGLQASISHRKSATGVSRVESDGASLAADVEVATTSAARLCTVFRHLEAIVQEVDDTHGASLEDDHALRERYASPLMLNLRSLRHCIQQWCIGPRWRQSPSGTLDS